MTLVTAWRHPKRPTCCRSWLAAAILAAAAPQSASAAADEPSCRPSDWFRGCTVSLVVENDLVSGTDRNYTSGVALRLTSSEGDVPDLVSRAAAPFIAPGARLRATYAIGQNLYTPENIETATPDPDDRPYGAWLYGSVGLLADAGDSLTSLELSIGVVGPMALGEETQTRVHEAIGSPKPLGWDSQLDNEPALLLTAEHKWQTRLIGRLFGFGLDVAPYVGGAVGNVFTYADAGLTFRLGLDLPKDYGPPRVQPSSAGSGYFSPVSTTGGAYLFAGVEARAVLHNIFLDGNLLSDSPSVDRKTAVGDFYTGFAVNYGDVRISYTHVFRTPEFDGQNDFDSFGALGVTVRF
jgi:lipid A 3-O-deacylase